MVGSSDGSCFFTLGNVPGVEGRFASVLFRGQRGKIVTRGLQNGPWLRERHSQDGYRLCSLGDPWGEGARRSLVDYIESIAAIMAKVSRIRGDGWASPATTYKLGLVYLLLIRRRDKTFRDSTLESVDRSTFLDGLCWWTGVSGAGGRRFDRF